MQTILLKEFIMSGALNGVTIGAELDEVKEILGEPSQTLKRTTGMRKRGEHKWLYGDFDFFFHRKLLAKVTFQCSASQKTSFAKGWNVDFWFLEAGMSETELRQQFIVNHLLFIESEPHSFGWNFGAVFLFPSGTHIACRDKGFKMMGISLDSFMPIGLV